MPRRSASSNTSTRPSSSASTSSNPTGVGTTDSCSSAALVGAGSNPSRATTASLTVRGTRPGGAASTSVTKNGLPPVSACSSAPLARLPASSATASADSGGGRTQRAPASSPNSARSGWSATRSPPRTVSTSTPHRSAIRRAA